MTWEEMIAIEPLLEKLRKEAAAVKDDGHPDGFCAHQGERGWYSIFKPRLVELVGIGAKNQMLRSHVAYDIAYDTVYNELPNCRCGDRCACA